MPRSGTSLVEQILACHPDVFACGELDTLAFIARNALGAETKVFRRPEDETIQEIIHRDQPYTFLWEPQRLAGLARTIRGARPNSLSSYFMLREWWRLPA